MRVVLRFGGEELSCGGWGGGSVWNIQHVEQTKGNVGNVTRNGVRIQTCELGIGGDDEGAGCDWGPPLRVSEERCAIISITSPTSGWSSPSALVLISNNRRNFNIASSYLPWNTSHQSINHLSQSQSNLTITSQHTCDWWTAPILLRLVATEGWSSPSALSFISSDRL